MFNHATSLHDKNAPFAYAITIPNEASVGAVEINDPLRSGLATSVMYTIAGPVENYWISKIVECSAEDLYSRNTHWFQWQSLIRWESALPTSCKYLWPLPLKSIPHNTGSQLILWHLSAQSIPLKLPQINNPPERWNLKKKRVSV